VIRTGITNQSEGTRKHAHALRRIFNSMRRFWREHGTRHVATTGFADFSILNAARIASTSAAQFRALLADKMEEFAGCAGFLLRIDCAGADE
jgi:hypothetical protein